MRRWEKGYHGYFRSDIVRNRGKTGGSLLREVPVFQRRSPVPRRGFPGRQRPEFGPWGQPRGFRDLHPAWAVPSALPHLLRFSRKSLINPEKVVTPLKAGVRSLISLDSGVRRNDGTAFILRLSNSIPVRQEPGRGCRLAATTHPLPAPHPILPEHRIVLNQTDHQGEDAA